MANFKVWAENSDNLADITTQESEQTDGVLRVEEGLIQGDSVKSDEINSILRQNSLMTTALAEAFLSEENDNFSYGSNFDDINKILKERIQGYHPIIGTVSVDKYKFDEPIISGTVYFEKDQQTSTILNGWRYINNVWQKFLITELKTTEITESQTFSIKYPQSSIFVEAMAPGTSSPNEIGMVGGSGGAYISKIIELPADTFEVEFTIQIGKDTIGEGPSPTEIKPKYRLSSSDELVSLESFFVSGFGSGGGGGGLRSTGATSSMPGADGFQFGGGGGGGGKNAGTGDTHGAKGGNGGIFGGGGGGGGGGTFVTDYKGIGGAGGEGLRIPPDLDTDIKSYLLSQFQIQSTDEFVSSMQALLEENTETKTFGKGGNGQSVNQLQEDANGEDGSNGFDLSENDYFNQSLKPWFSLDNGSSSGGSGGQLEKRQGTFPDRIPSGCGGGGGGGVHGVGGQGGNLILRATSSGSIVDHFSSSTIGAGGGGGGGYFSQGGAGESLITDYSTYGTEFHYSSKTNATNHNGKEETSWQNILYDVFQGNQYHSSGGGGGGGGGGYGGPGGDARGPFPGGGGGYGKGGHGGSLNKEPGYGGGGSVNIALNRSGSRAEYQLQRQTGGPGICVLRYYTTTFLPERLYY